MPAKLPQGTGLAHPLYDVPDMQMETSTLRLALYCSCYAIGARNKTTHRFNSCMEVQHGV
eukprot:10756510-Lingulodinium_polyedra.AAC.1